MRVAIFTDNDVNKVNGVTTTLTAVLDHAAPDVQPRIYTAAGLASEEPDYLALASIGIPMPFYRGMRMYVPKARQYLRHVRENGTDLLHLTTPGPLGLTALWVAARTGLPLVGSFHTDLGAYVSILSGSTLLGRWMNEYMRWMYGRCRVVLVPSAASLDALVRCGFPSDRRTVWPRGVDINLFTPTKRLATLRRRWEADDDHPVVLYVGRLSREKGVELLPSIADRLRHLGVPCRLVIAGDGPLRRWLTEQCPEAIFTGALGREQVAEVFASADVCVFPSRTDTAGNVVLEAQASGLPVVVADAGGPPENIVSGMTGLVCESTDARSWANALAVMLEHADQRRAMGAAARRYALSRQWEHALEPLFGAYRRVHNRVGTTGAVTHAA